MNMHAADEDRKSLPPLDSHAGLEARLLRLMEVTLAAEQHSRSLQDSAVQPLSAEQLRRNALAELLVHAGDGYFDHMNSLVKRSALYSAGIVVFAICMLWFNEAAIDHSGSAGRILSHGSAPATMHLRSISDWNCD